MPRYLHNSWHAAQVWQSCLDPTPGCMLQFYNVCLTYCDQQISDVHWQGQTTGKSLTAVPLLVESQPLQIIFSAAPIGINHYHLNASPCLGSNMNPLCHLCATETCSSSSTGAFCLRGPRYPAHAPCIRKRGSVIL